LADGSRIDISYEPVSDRLRIVLRESGRMIGIELTRRLLKVFLEHVTGVLERTVPDAGAGTDPRAAVCFEHLEAAGLPDTPQPPSADESENDSGDTARKTRPEAWTLALKINLKVREGVIHLTFIDTEHRANSLALDRTQCHRVLSALIRKARAADWNLEPYMDWLAEVGAARPHAGAGHAH
jgi:hypothetical protein